LGVISIDLKVVINQKIYKDLIYTKDKEIKMQVRKTLTSIVLVGALALGGIGCSDNGQSNQQVNNQYQTIIGVPISVAESYARLKGSLATVLDVEGKYVLAYTSKGNTRTNAEATALIQSEISDGDEEPIELMGRYDGNRFIIKRVNANGYQVDF